jgi:hypothetical protein
VWQRRLIRCADTLLLDLKGEGAVPLHLEAAERVANPQEIVGMSRSSASRVGVRIIRTVTRLPALPDTYAK